MDRWAGKLAIVTGASSGIGEAVTRTLVREGVNVLGLARREENLKKIQNEVIGYKGLFYYLKCDINNENEILDAFKYAETHFRGVDILISNAGIARTGPFIALKVKDMHDVVSINLIGAVICIKETLKSMRKHKKEGHIIIINSLTGINPNAVDPIPANIYPATKFGLRAIADNVRFEIAEAQNRIRLTSIYPGLVRTALVSTAKMNNGIKDSALFGALQTKDVADSVLYVLSTPSHVQVQDLVINKFNANE